MSWFKSCVGCSGKKKKKGQLEERVLDYRHTSLKQVPPDVFMSERTLEELYLDSNQLKELPRDMFYCHGLKILGLSDNDLQMLPPAIASFANLESLDLSKNEISSIPDSIKSCKHLAIVDASINPMGKLPESFTQIMSLKQLYLNDIFLEYLPANFGRLCGLEILELRENHLNTLPKSMGRLTALRRLDIGQNDFSELPEVVGSLPSLTDLWFDNNKVKSIPPMVGKLKKLVFIDASKNRIDWVADEIDGCSHLTDLHLSMNNLKELPETLGACKAMQVLRLDDNALTHLPESTGGLTALEELVASQNDLERLPGSVGLLRSLHTLHLDDNLILELPPELGSCNKLKILTVSANKLSAVPPELGHISQLAVMNLCDNLIRNLPVSFTKLKLRALWLSDNQAKPLVQLQSETDQITGQKVLTCYMLPQVEKDHVTDSSPKRNEDNFPGPDWDEQRRAKSQIKFAFDSNIDKPGKLTRAPTPYPKELKELAKHARNLQNVKGDSTQSSATTVPKECTSTDSASKNNDYSRPSDTILKNGSTVVLASSSPSKKEQIELKIIDKNNSNINKTTDNAYESTIPDAEEILTIVKATESRPQLREAKTIRSVQTTSTPSSTSNLTSASSKTDLHSQFNTTIDSSNTYNTPLSNSFVTSEACTKALPTMSSTNALTTYATDDKKSLGKAEVVATNKQVEDEDEKTDNIASNNIDSNVPESAYDRRTKKPPPYHVAAPLSKQAAAFSFDGVPQTKQGSASSPLGSQEEECSSSSSSSADSGYGNGSIVASSPTSGGSLQSTNKKDEKRPPSLALPSNLPSHMARPASVAVGSRYDRPHDTGNKQRPGSLALSETMRTYSTGQSDFPKSGFEQDQHNSTGYDAKPRPGSIAAPINTVGIPPAPARAVSHTALHLQHNISPLSQTTSYSVSNLNQSGSPYNPSYNNRIYQPQSRFSVDNPPRSISQLSPIKSPSEQFFKKKFSDPQSPTDSGRISVTPTTTGLVSIIDQVTSGILEDSGSSTHEGVLAPSSPDSGSIIASDCPPTPSSLSSVTQSPNSKGPTNFTQDQPSGKIVTPTPHRPMSNEDQTECYTNRDGHLSNSQSTPISMSTSKLPTVHGKTSIPSLNHTKPDHGRESQTTSKISYNQQISKTSLDGQTRIPIPGTMNAPPIYSRQDSFDKSKSPTHIPQTRTGIVSPGFTSKPSGNLDNSAIDQTDSTPLKKHSNGSGSHIPAPGYSHIPNSYSNQTEKSQISSPSASSTPKSSTNSNPDTSSSRCIPRFNSKSSITEPNSSYSTNGTNNNSYQPNLKSSNQIPSYSSTNYSSTSNGDSSKLSFSSEKKYESPYVKTPPPTVTSSLESRIPSIGGSGRSPSNLSNHHSVTPDSKIPMMSNIGRSSSSLSNHSDMSKETSKIPMLGSSGRSHSNLQKPSNTMSLLSQQAINTPGIPLISPSPTSNKYGSGIPTPGSYTPNNRTGGSRLPVPGSTSRQHTPEHTRSPGSGIRPPSQSPGIRPPSSNNSSPWMFGHHTNARVFPVVIEKNPGLGFTIGERTGPDHCIYVTSVTTGGPASSALKPGDKILQIDGIDLNSSDASAATTIMHNAGATITMLVSRIN